MATVTDQTAVITGGARGIGRKIAERLATDGSHVVILDVSDRGQETVDELSKSGLSVEFREADVTDEASMATAFEDLDIDILVNNAALFRPLLDDVKRFDEISINEWDSVMDVNAKGVFISCKQALPHIQNGASIVNISSNTVNTGIPGMLHYVASKAALIGLTRSMATELGDLDIRVNAIMPGLTASETILEEYEEVAIEDRASKQAINRLVEPEDIANAVAFMAGPDSEMVTGKVLVVDGGYTYF